MRFRKNNDFDSCNTNITPEIIEKSVIRYETCQNHIYEVDRNNELTGGIAVTPGDPKNIGLSDNMVKCIAPLIGGTINENGNYPDILFNNGTGVEAKGTWFRKNWKSPIAKEYKNKYGYGKPNPLWVIPNTISLNWSAHYQNECCLLGFAWDWDEDGNIRVIGTWLAELVGDDWGNPTNRKLNSKNTPCVTTKKSAKRKLANNWAVVDCRYYDVLRKSGYVT